MPVPDFVTQLREHVGHSLLPLVGVTGVVLDDEGRVLLHQRSDDGRWATPGGILEPGEQPAQAVVREVWEETGVRVEVDRLVTVIGQEPHTYPNGDRVQFLDLAFRCRPVGGRPRVDGDESLDVDWFAESEMPPMAERILERVRWARGDDGEPYYER
ncbi:NUDIX domain-containing protein [Nocardiopsis sp. L17-MgMaSL7]|uniref:NUDIX hydrolase n=1 Tax=Nocardiopsis sp. L17-MgMaSL7 TaxID=1938893 RepID=UPI000D717992|nr:NUDIX domain-containing protein [Nocardiopsis sp. L17-MgMaSL7]PWV45742.1 ADP-ribose pyrophosphatase YjhB (NUDIX family) [Nocardiopsis sp. L17-MgMaSL7]